jgi:PKD repeat protein
MLFDRRGGIVEQRCIHPRHGGPDSMSGRYPLEQLRTLPALLIVLVASAALLLLLPGTSDAQSPVLTASFDYAPASPVPGQEVTLTATSTSSSTSPPRHQWDLDGDGQFDDAFGDSAKTSFAQAGSYVVRLKATQSAAAGTLESTAERTITVGTGTGPDPEPQPTPGNQPPQAVYDRQCKKVGTLLMCAGLVARESQPKLLDASKSRDSDGQIVKYEWDLDSNGSFEIDTGTTPTLTHTFEALTGLVDARKRTVRVRVTDDKGGTDVDEVTLTLLEPACQPQMTAGSLKAKSLCLRMRRLDGGAVTRWYSKHPVVLNGITVAPLGGRTFVIDIPQGGNPEIKVGRAAVTVPVKGSTAQLLDGRVSWRLSNGRLQGFEADGKAKLNGLGITGMPEVPQVFTDGTSKLSFFVALPQQFGGSTSDQPITLRPGAAGASAEPLSFGVSNASIGPIGLEQLLVTYDGVDLWEIAAKVGLPEPLPYEIEGGAGIRAGNFEYGRASIDNLNVPIGPVFLQKINFRIEVSPQESECVPKVGKKTYDMEEEIRKAGVNVDLPEEDRYVTIDYGVPTFALCGGVGLTAGPQILGAAAIRLDAGLGFATYADRPHVLRAFGDVSLVEIPLAHADFEMHTDGYMKMLAKFHWGIEDLATLSGYIKFEAMFPKFNAEGRVDACLEFVDWCAGAKALVSSKGVAVCAKIDVLVDDWEPGFGYRWGDSFPDLYFAGCDLGPYREHFSRASASRAGALAAGDTRSIDLPAGLPGAVVALKGKDAAPKVTLIGPNGERITTPDGLMPVEQSPFFVLKDPRAKLTQIAISKPSAGRWRVEIEPGSSEIVSLRSAEGLDEPQVKARVTGRGHRRAVAYRVKPLEGQKVTFLESGPSTGGVIGVAKGREGTLRFSPADGAAERRKIVALVEQDGQVRDRIEIASYRAPAASRPGRPAGLRVRRSRSALTATWRGVKGAPRYQAAVRLSSGRRALITTKRRRVVIRGLGRGTTGSVQVRALSAAGMKGRAAVAKVRRSRAR